MCGRKTFIQRRISFRYNGFDSIQIEDFVFDCQGNFPWIYFEWFSLSCFDVDEYSSTDWTIKLPYSYSFIVRSTSFKEKKKKCVTNCSTWKRATVPILTCENQYRLGAFFNIFKKMNLPFNCWSRSGRIGAKQTFEWNNRDTKAQTFSSIR